MEAPITSVKNDVIQLFHRLKSKKGRKEAGVYLIEGARLCEECINRCADAVTMMLYSERMATSPLLTLAKEKGIPMRLCTDACMEKACDSEQSQGIAMAVRLPDASADAPVGPTVALDAVADPGNMGTILRTAWAFGVKDVYLGKGCVDVYSPKVVRSAMGAHFAVRIHMAEDLAAVLSELKTMGYEVIGAHLKGESGSLKENHKRCVVIGSEARGMSEAAANACTRLYRIPMEGDAESLNAAVAAAILMDRSFHP